MNAVRLLLHVNDSKSARRASRFGRADDRLSRAASAIVAMERLVGEACTDLALFGARDVIGLVCVAAEKRLAGELRALGFEDADAVHRAAVERISGKSAYHNGI